jgi:hypothetical protein
MSIKTSAERICMFCAHEPGGCALFSGAGPAGVALSSLFASMSGRRLPGGDGKDGCGPLQNLDISPPPVFIAG